MDKVAVIGTGYVGLVIGACLSDYGLKVICVDNDEQKIKNLQKGIIPIYEPGLEVIINRNVVNKRLEFTVDINKAVQDCGVIYIAVGTPSLENGGTNLEQVETVVGHIGQSMNGYKVIVTKSTVPIGTGKMIKELITKELNKRGVQFSFDLVSNPEFLREGSAVRDFSQPDRIVIGAESPRVWGIIRDIYQELLGKDMQFIQTNMETAELIKYASNAFLALKITFINEIANLCEKVGANVQEVAQGMGTDQRIGPYFLSAGPGYGGSCFPKDTRALARTAAEHGVDLTLVSATILANERQRLLQARKIIGVLGDLQGKQIAILGLAFKPNTSDMRQAPSIAILGELAQKGARFRVYDPSIRQTTQQLTDMQHLITYCNDEYEALQDANAVVIITEWEQFKNLDLARVKLQLKEPYFFDLRNIYKRSLVEAAGFVYFGVGQ